MKKISASILACCAVTALVGVPTAVAAQDIDKVVKARRGYYQMVSINAGPLFGMAKGDIDYDAALVGTLAANLQAISSIDVANLFAPGTDKEALPGQTRALPKIWADFPGVGAKGAAFKEAVDGLAANGGGGLDALRAEVGKLGASCKGCHDNYRAKDF